MGHGIQRLQSRAAGHEQVQAPLQFDHRLAPQVHPPQLAAVVEAAKDAWHVLMGRHAEQRVGQH